MPLFQSKAQRASKHANKATAMFDAAHARLSQAVELLGHAVIEHFDRADAHTALAAEAVQTTRELNDEAHRVARVRDNIAALVK